MEPRAELVGGVGGAVHAISPWLGQMGRREKSIKSQSQQKPTLLLLLAFHHLLVAVGLLSWVALELTLVVMDSLGTVGTVSLAVMWNKALLAFLQKLNS